jgi:hypothetical protein
VLARYVSKLVQGAAGSLNQQDHMEE